VGPSWSALVLTDVVAFNDCPLSRKSFGKKSLDLTVDEFFFLTMDFLEKAQGNQYVLRYQTV
jgi:hypothetical protein